MHLQHLATMPTHIVLMYANRTRFNLFTEQLLAAHNLEQLVAIVVRITFIRLPNLFLQADCTILIVDLLGCVVVQVACTSSAVLQWCVEPFGVHWCCMGILNCFIMPHWRSNLGKRPTWVRSLCRVTQTSRLSLERALSVVENV